MLPAEEAILDKLRAVHAALMRSSGLQFQLGEVFVAVVCMSQDGRVFLRQLGFST
jgi:hypothetical protein